MDTKFIFVTGGVVSGLGKGITAASLGRLLKARGLKVTVMKLDPYLNVDPGTMNPMQHGEVFVTDDGAETDLDLGHYERFIDESLSQNSNLTSGRVFFQVISDERKGIYGGQTIQVIPHITNEIKRRIALNTEADVVFVEIGGTVGDIEGQPFLEAIRQFAQEHGRENCMFIHVTLIPYLSASMELKTKPTQHSVKELLGLGIRPDVIVCRCEHPIDSHIREKIALFCNVPKKHVIENRDMPTLYEIPLALEKEGLAEIAIRQLHLKCSAPDLTDWVAMVERNRHLGRAVDIALVGKYVELHDSYLSVAEALKHGGIENDAQVRIHWLDSERITPENVEETFQGIDGILVPGGFGKRALEGKICAAEYAREHKIPYLGICLGMQVAVCEFARNVVGLAGASSSEFDPDGPYSVIDLMSSQEDVTEKGGTMRLGAYPCRLAEGTLAREAYGSELVYERHRHRYEFNNAFRQEMEDAGLVISGTSPDGRLVETVELPGRDFHLGAQFHPEFKSRPNRAHPLFKGFIAAALKFRIKAQRGMMHV